MKESATGNVNFNKLREKGRAHPIEATGNKLRAPMHLRLLKINWLIKNLTNEPFSNHLSCRQRNAHEIANAESNAQNCWQR